MMWIMRSVRRPLVHFRAASAAAAANFSSSAAALEAERSVREGARNDWRKEEIKSIYDSPILDLLFHAVCCLHFHFLMHIVLIFNYCYPIGIVHLRFVV